ncbi:hypothetical protein GF1_21470 [Desulfolithobacter dissulfuricans]|uniref:Uncharacterized protein n=1 Tax=Desulfolithobacter dissulfuricans TaxID=2795293 RepID=A0A915UAA3_9BACT|nr:hypothetical protein [Desulfolithobacter dissulfuricans]BCO09771.1 hypothetical protein GF1_21470 [Desulfolithobacter dissulfuricans]
MATVITASFGQENTLKNIVDDLVNIGLPSEKFFVDAAAVQIKIICAPSVEKEIFEVIERHNPTTTQRHELKEQGEAKVITATYGSEDTLKNVVDDLINIGLPAEEVYADKKSKQVKVITGSAIEREIREVLSRHNPSEIC